jgi:hypothetical protein
LNFKGELRELDAFGVYVPNYKRDKMNTLCGGSMRKYIPLVLLFLACAFLNGAHAYTVVLKSGKIINGTLISETPESIVFKDDSGVQYSLKKSSLDTQKMEQANAPKTEPAPAAPVEMPVEKKKARTYTKEDLDALRSKYGELTLGREKIVNAEDFENGVLKPEAYMKYLREGVTRIPQIMGNLQILRDAVAVAWEDAARNNKDVKEAVNAYLAGPSATDLNKSILAAMGDLEVLNDTLSTYPTGYDDGYKFFAGALLATLNYHKAITSIDPTMDVNTFRNNLDQLSRDINTNINGVQTWQPPVPKEEPATAPKPGESPGSETPVPQQEPPQKEPDSE